MAKLRKPPIVKIRGGRVLPSMQPGDRGFLPQPSLECAFIADLIVRHDGTWEWKTVTKNGVPRRAEFRDDGAWYWID